jgi:class 3 adenylate cyclase
MNSLVGFGAATSFAAGAAAMLVRSSACAVLHVLCRQSH